MGRQHPFSVEIHEAPSRALLDPAWPDVLQLWLSAWSRSSRFLSAVTQLVCVGEKTEYITWRQARFPAHFQTLCAVDDRRRRSIRPRPSPLVRSHRWEF